MAHLLKIDIHPTLTSIPMHVWVVSWWTNIACQCTNTLMPPPLFPLFEKGGLNPRSQSESRGNSKVKPPKDVIVLGWVTFPTLDFWGTLPPRVHPIIEGVSGWTRYFQQTMWEHTGLPLRKIGAGHFVHTRSSCSLRMETINLGGGL